MSKDDTQPALVPRLRFPEFRNAPPWSETVFTGICDVNPSHAGLPDSFYYIDLESVEAGTLQSPQRIERANAPSRAQRLLQHGDILYQTVRPYQRNNLLFNIADGDAYVASTGYAQLRARESIGFLYQLVHTDSFVKRVLTKCTGSNYPAINSSDLESVSVWIPPEPAEQQKIADCLGSLDDLIAAEGRKLAALRDHKQGLMQQLFPRQGETQPRLRFPEFRDRWTRRTLGTVVEEFSANSTVQDEHEVLTSARRGLMRQVEYYGEGRITKRNNIGFNIIPPDHITYRSRSDDGKFYFNINDLGITGIISVYYPVFHAIEGSNPFLVALLNQFSADIGTHSVGSSQRVLPLSALMRYQLPLPEPPEQHRIAECLTAIDARIMAHAKRLDALRDHKYGLMQQLFPTPETK